ncbi:hypothetical protein NHX12_000881 [Muraenolepis orangiensis]|uniref:Ig-like domain-containing protein n=1 Tax=Muraenolepis orangiensis TaxID=630683 RepID=A0A9Q0DZV4_9TELE|nr:hypothetical protein NHX12_000881 [Muraenolepis orangiensis]
MYHKPYQMMLIAGDAWVSHSNCSELIWYPGDLPAPLLTHPKEQVVEGTLVELGCSAPSPCHPHPTIVTWTPTLGRSTQLQRDNEVTSTLTFTASHRYHGNNISCTAIYLKQSEGKNVTISRSYQLSISFSPRNTSVSGSPCHPAREGGCLNLTCTSHANPAVSEFTWYRIHGERILQIGKGSALSIQLFNTSNWFFCEVWNGIGTKKSNVYKIDIQDTTCSHPDLLPWIAATGVLAVVLLFTAVCAVRAWKLANQIQRRSNDATINQGPSYKEDTQVFNTSQEDIYINTGVLMNTVGPREGAVGPREGAVGPREGAVGPREGAVGPREGAVGPGEEAVGPREGAVGPREGAVGPREGAVGPREGAVGPGEEAVGPREGAVPGTGSVWTHHDTACRAEERVTDPAPDMQVEDCDVLYTTIYWKKKPEPP